MVTQPKFHANMPKRCEDTALHLHCGALEVNKLHKIPYYVPYRL